MDMSPVLDFFFDSSQLVAKAEEERNKKRAEPQSHICYPQKKTPRASD